MEPGNTPVMDTIGRGSHHHRACVDKMTDTIGRGSHHHRACDNQAEASRGKARIE
jgi:hypothetical protein